MKPVDEPGVPTPHLAVTSLRSCLTPKLSRLGEEDLGDSVGGCGEDLEDVAALLSGSGDDGSAGRRSSSARPGAERAGDFQRTVTNPTHKTARAGQLQSCAKAHLSR